jgi:hypothetical protein
MTNDRDQALLRSAVSDAAANLLAFVPSLGTRELVGFGEGVPLPTRLTFKYLPRHLLPRSEAVGQSPVPLDSASRTNLVQMVVDRWRGASITSHARQDEDVSGPDTPSHEDSGATSAGNRIDQARYQILRR